MAKLPENTPDSLPEWRDVFQLETNTAALGGEPVYDVDDEPTEGFMNAPLKQLLDRTTILAHRTASQVRNCVLAGYSYDFTGSSVYVPQVVQALTDSTMQLFASTGDPLVMSFADGIGKYGPVDHIAFIEAIEPIDATDILLADGNYVLCAEYDTTDGSLSYRFGLLAYNGVEVADYPPALTGSDAVVGRLWWNERMKRMHKSVPDGLDVVWQRACIVEIGRVTIDSGIIDSTATFEYGEMYSTLSSSIPTATVVSYAGYSAPKGWLLCNGGSHKIRDYRRLYDMIGTNFGGAGANFQVPDLRGRFVRGFDYGAGVDSGRLFASYQADELAAHTHTVASNNAGGAGAGAYLAGSGSTNATVTTSSAGGASETRPKNVALNYIIKY